MKFPFVGQAYVARSTNVNAQRCVNLYPEINPQDAKSVIALYGTPGMLLWATLTSNTVSIRGFKVCGSYLYAAAGNILYKVDSAGNSTTLGTLLTSSGVVSMDENGIQLMLVDGTYGYIVTLATAVFARITDADFPGADVVQFIDGYFIFNVPNTGRFMITALYGESVDALDFATAEGLPDDVVSVLVDHREVWLFGEISTEVWFNSGAADFPFERMQGAFIERGCAAKHSPAKMDNSIFWLGRGEKGHGVVWRANGYSPARVSTHNLEEALRGYSDISDAIGFVYEEGGHSFYVLIFPTGNATWVFDAASGMWHERAYRDPNLGTLRKHRANCHAFFAGKHLIGDSESGKIYEWDLDTYTDDSNPIKRLRSCQPIQSDEKRVKHSALEIDFERGVGLVTGQGSNPQAMMRFSDDGGHTFGNEHWRTIGAIGKYKTRVRWGRQGMARNRVYEVSITDPVKIVIIGASLGAR